MGFSPRGLVPDLAAFVVTDAMGKPPAYCNPRTNLGSAVEML